MFVYNRLCILFLAKTSVASTVMRSGAGSPGRGRLRRLRRAARGRARRAAQARRAFGGMHGRAGRERAAGRRIGHPRRPAPLAWLAGGPRELWVLSASFDEGDVDIDRQRFCFHGHMTRLAERTPKPFHHNPRRLRLRTPPGMSKPVSARGPGGEPCARLARCCPRRVPRPRQGPKGRHRRGMRHSEQVAPQGRTVRIGCYATRDSGRGRPGREGRGPCRSQGHRRVPSRQGRRGSRTGP